MKLEDLEHEALPPRTEDHAQKLAALQQAIEVGCRDIAEGRSMLFTANELKPYLNKRVEEILGER